MLKIPRINLKRRVTNLAMAATLLVSAVAPSLVIVPKAFATAGPAPVNLRAFVGGNSIALEWNPVTGDNPAQYKIYRGGVLKATVSPVTDNNSPATTQRWIDTAVTNGTAYSYQVSGVNAAAEESVKSTALAVTQPATPVAVPTITVSSSVPAAYVPALNAGKALLQTWYPKIVTKYGNPSGTPTSITLTTSPTATNPNTSFSTNTITVPESFLSGSSAAINAMWVHEATHILQHGNFAGWLQEGLASYTSDFIYSNGLPSVDNATATYLNGYGDVSVFLNWISTTYNKPNFVKDIQAATVGNVAPATSFYKTQTGLTLGELWEQMTGRRMSSQITFKNVGASSQCLDIVGSGTAPGTDLQLYTCNDSGAQKFTWIPDSNSSDQGELYSSIYGGGNSCLDVWGSGTTVGTRVEMYTCNHSTAQKWVIQPNGALRNPTSGLCVQPVGAGTAITTKMELSTCTAANIQNWLVRPLGMLKSFSGFACATAGTTTGSTTSGTGAYYYGCSTDQYFSQQFKLVPSAVGSTTVKIQANTQNLCLHPVGNGTASGTLIEVQTCNAATASQNWQWQADNTVKNISSGLCLNSPSGTGGTQLQLISCASPTSFTKWDVLYQY